MSKQRVAQILTLAILIAALSVVAWRKSILQPAAPKAAATAAAATAEDAIYAMLDAARAGDTAAYLAAFTGQTRRTLEQAVAEQGGSAFVRYLQQSNAPVKGVALQPPQPVTNREVKVQVEYIYQDRNEVQQMYLERSPDGWKISRVDSAERIKTLIPYGTPVQ